MKLYRMPSFRINAKRFEIIIKSIPIFFSNYLKSFMNLFTQIIYFILFTSHNSLHRLHRWSPPL